MHIYCYFMHIYWVWNVFGHTAAMHLSPVNKDLCSVSRLLQYIATSVANNEDGEVAWLWNYCLCMVWRRSKGRWPCEGPHWIMKLLNKIGIANLANEICIWVEDNYFLLSMVLQICLCNYSSCFIKLHSAWKPTWSFDNGDDGEVWKMHTAVQA